MLLYLTGSGNIMEEKAGRMQDMKEEEIRDITVL